MDKINEQNKKFNDGTATFEYGLNEFADMTSDEFMDFVKSSGLILDPSTANNAQQETNKNIGRQSIPASVDWRTLGYVTPIKNQGQCGSCWAFSSISALESYNYKVNKKLINYSEQQLVDCVYTRDGCQGGFMTTAFSYMAKNGTALSASYPYKSGTTKTVI